MPFNESLEHIIVIKYHPVLFETHIKEEGLLTKKNSQNPLNLHIKPPFDVLQLSCDIYLIVLHNK